jgi:uncharacterized protein (DUF1015 family)
MADIFPFAAYRYDPARVSLDNVLTQPYDKITSEMQARYYESSPYNLIAVEKGKSSSADTPTDNVYTRAAARLNDWIAAGILVHEPAPAVYVYSQDYQVPATGRRAARKGFIALGRVEDYPAGVVFRHELTHTGPKADRLELLRRTRTHTGQLFMLYSDPTRRIDALLDDISRAPATIEVRDEFAVVHRVWPVTDPQQVARFVAEMTGKKLIIADGHHRYETALAYRDECRRAGATGADAAHEKVMMTFVNTHAEGLTILPTHRVVANLSGFALATFRERLSALFDWYAYPFAGADERAVVLDDFRKDLARRGRERRALGAYAASGVLYLFLLRRDADLAALLPDLSPSQRSLDIVLLHRLVLERGLGISADAVMNEQHISYERELEAALAAVDAGRAQLCCLLNPVRVEQVAEIALAGDVLPQKSTDFYPKLLSGLTLYRLDG